MRRGLFFFCFSLLKTIEILFWVYQKGNFLSGKSISCREKNQEKWLCPLWKIFLLHPSTKPILIQYKEVKTCRATPNPDFPQTWTKVENQKSGWDNTGECVQSRRPPVTLNEHERLKLFWLIWNKDVLVIFQISKLIWNSLHPHKNEIDYDLSVDDDFFGLLA